MSNIEVTQNFDWSVTDRKLCIFMPNYHNAKFTKFSLERIKTEVPKDDYVVIVGNDNTDDNFDEFAQDNIFYFSLKREDKGLRNGGFIRNYVIKRCQSQRFFQKDGEVVILGDFIKNCLEWETPWRAGNIYVLTDEQTEEYMKTGDTDGFIDTPTKKIEEIFPDTVEEVKELIRKAKGCLNLSTYNHYAYCVDTSVLKNMNGYDEDFTYYGFEDSDMFCRLYAQGLRIIPDYSCSAVHLCHPRDELVINKINRMGGLFERKNPNKIKRNRKRWGEGI